MNVVRTSFVDKWERHLSYRAYQHGASIAEQYGQLELVLPYLSPEDRILDIGCGSGGLVRQLRERGYDATGITYCESEVDVWGAERPDDRNAILLADAHDLPFDDNSFMLVTAFHSLEHLLSPIVAVREISRVLQGEGRFVYEVPVGVDGIEEDPPNPEHVSILLPKQWQCLVRRAGFGRQQDLGDQRYLASQNHKVYAYHWNGEVRE